MPPSSNRDDCRRSRVSDTLATDSLCSGAPEWTRASSQSIRSFSASSSDDPFQDDKLRVTNLLKIKNKNFLYRSSCANIMI